jgi:hypothetical protein
METIIHQEAQKANPFENLADLKFSFMPLELRLSQPLSSEVGFKIKSPLTDD